jgi:hemerythrin-like domain-containing protein
VITEASDAAGFALLKEDHRRVEELFQRFERFDPGMTPTVKADLRDDLVRELSRHAAIEEQVLYPFVGQVLSDGTELVKDSLAEHQRVKQSLVTLERLDVRGEEFALSVRKLMTDVRRHVHQEEQGLFPRLAREASDERLETVSRLLETARLAAPSHPHPHAPRTFPLNVVVGLPIALVDRTRDLLTAGAKGLGELVRRVRSQSEE